MSVPAPPPPDPLADIDAFLAAPPPPPAQIHVTNAIRREPVTAGRVAGAFANEAVSTVFGLDDDGSPAPRITRVQWMRGGVELARIERRVAHPQAVRAAILAASHLRIPVINRYENNRLFGTDTVGGYFAKSLLPEPGKLARRGGLDDTVQHLDLMVGRIDRPGRIGRTVLRRNDEHLSFRARLDADGLVVETNERGGGERVHIELGELVGVVVSHGGARTNSWWAATVDGVEQLPKLDGFAGADGEYELERWLWARVNQRLGL